MALTATKSKGVVLNKPLKKSPKKLTLLDLIDIDQLVNEHAEVVNISNDTKQELQDDITNYNILKEKSTVEDKYEDQPSPEDAKQPKGKTPRKCSYCRKSFTIYSKLKEHVKNCEMKKHKCKECELKFATESKLERHVNERHLQIKEFECKDCDKSFARKDKLADHVEAVHQKKQKYLCSECGKGFYHKFNMTRHVITCKKRGKRKEPRECPECEREFNFKSELKRHIEVVHLKVKKHKCDFCGKGFSQKCMLEDHVNAVHLKKKEHQCKDCGNNFARLSQLNRHVSAVHLLEKQHECPECDKCFARKDRLKQHVMAVHLKNLIKSDVNETIADESAIETIDSYTQNITEHQKTFSSTGLPTQSGEPESIVGVVDQLNNFNVVTSDPSVSALETTTVVLNEVDYVQGDYTIDENEYEVVVNVPANLQLSNNRYKTDNILTTRLASQENNFIRSQANDLVIVDENEIKKQRESMSQLGHGTTKPIKYVCPECDQGFSRKDRLKTHIIDTHLTIEDEYVSADDVDNNSTSKQAIQENSMCIIDHLAYADDKGRRITNSLFNSGLSEEERKEKMKRDLVFDSEQNKYECPECPKRFARTDKLDDHISTVHFMERRHQCTTCGKSFAYKHGLERHVSAFHLKEGKHRCRLCEDRFDEKEDLDTHNAEVHSNLHKLKCEECDKMFSRKRSLAEHVSIAHLKEKKYKCPKCNKAFSTKGVRKSHMAVHSKEKPHKCGECGKGFNYKHILARHILAAHPAQSNKETFKCADCDKSFLRQIRLLKHVKAVHAKNKQVTCTDCENTFETIDEMKKHIELDHLKENSVTEREEDSQKINKIDD